MPNQGHWWYANEDGTYAQNGWFWLDENRDGAAECYYFDREGWMLADTVTPDGYTVNADGAWVENGIVQSKPGYTVNERWKGRRTGVFCTMG